jgi:hypothetical protein
VQPNIARSGRAFRFAPSAEASPNNRLIIIKQTAALARKAEDNFQATGKKQHLFTAFPYQGDSWDHHCRIIAKVLSTIIPFPLFFTFSIENLRLEKASMKKRRGISQLRIFFICVQH